MFRYSARSLGDVRQTFRIADCESPVAATDCCVLLLKKHAFNPTRSVSSACSRLLWRFHAPLAASFRHRLASSTCYVRCCCLVEDTWQHHGLSSFASVPFAWLNICVWPVGAFQSGNRGTWRVCHLVATRSFMPPSSRTLPVACRLEVTLPRCSVSVPPLTGTARCGVAQLHTTSRAVSILATATHSSVFF